MNIVDILNEAHLTANEAIKREIATNGPENMNAFDCGFAWVTVTDGRHEFVRKCRKALKDAGLNPYGQPIQLGDTMARDRSGQITRCYGSKSYSGKGWQFWKPGGFAGQSIRIHEAGARGFAAVLRKYDIPVEVGSRYD